MKSTHGLVNSDYRVSCVKKYANILILVNSTHWDIISFYVNHTQDHAYHLLHICEIIIFMSQQHVALITIIPLKINFYSTYITPLAITCIHNDETPRIWKFGVLEFLFFYIFFRNKWMKNITFISGNKNIKFHYANNFTLNIFCELFFSFLQFYLRMNNSMFRVFEKCSIVSICIKFWKIL